jgi:hypothetical protein
MSTDSIKIDTSENNTVLDDRQIIDIDENDQEVSEITLDDAKAVVEYSGRAPSITLEPDFLASPPKDQIRYLHKLASAMNHAAKTLQDERNALLTAMEKQKELVIHAETGATIQKNIAANALAQLNAMTQENAIRTGHHLSKISTLETIVKAAGLSID